MKIRFIFCLVVLAGAITMLFEGCDSSSNGNGYNINGGRVYGGCFTISQTEYITSLYPLSTIDVYSSTIARQIFEGLVKLNTKDLSVIPSLAESWEVDETGTVYTFHLKKDVKFHDDPCFNNAKGREMTASDVKFSLETLCTQSEDNLMFNLILKDKLLGANEYYEVSASGKPDFDLEGLKVIDDYTIQMTLSSANSSFLYLLALTAASIVPSEAIEKYGNQATIGTGPFTLSPGPNLKAEQFVLLKNRNYHGVDSLGNQLPFIDSVKIAMLDSKRAELEAFKKGNVDVVIGLPSESIKEIVEEQISNFQSQPPLYILDRSPEMATQYYVLNLTREVFKDKRVRQALNYAIDRNRIIENILKGQAFGPGHHGITPPSFKDYDISQIKGYSFNPDKAKQLLAEAGYPEGKGFPQIKLELNSSGFKNTSIAIEIQKQWSKTLEINIDLEVVPLAKKLDDELFGRADVFRSGWIADVPWPVDFLHLFYGKNVPESLEEPSHPNSSRYVNPEFDELYEKGLAASDKSESYQYFAQAEQVLMDDAATIILFYTESYVLIQSDVRNYFSNPMNYRDFSQIYFKAPVAAITKKG
ncbi:MAG: peptide ABC transporter substrate-binding protein [Flavobacteriales bacterium]|nr:MAG: peptide ABC transporter substrate-binding protein [Flavobacteriales bacterium]